MEGLIVLIKPACTCISAHRDRSFGYQRDRFTACSETGGRGLAKHFHPVAHDLTQPSADLRYAQFVEHYRRYVGALKHSMRRQHRAGGKLFIDYAGPTLPMIDPATGEISRAHMQHIQAALPAGAGLV
ncbi:hypothetical protein [Pseudomonas lopnurensis]|uniref:hypothetical protein n=1 Tax=Pseudomonas lopnurensis TaxID=1477517 RepID=UPI003F68BAE8